VNLDPSLETNCISPFIFNPKACSRDIEEGFLLPSPRLRRAGDCEATIEEGGRPAVMREADGGKPARRQAGSAPTREKAKALTQNI
jgi:hypothetical protein